MKTFTIIFISVFLATALANSIQFKESLEYKVDFVSATSTEPLNQYLGRQGSDGWEIWNYTDYADGRQYIFKR